MTAETGAHLSSARLEHLGEALIQQPVARVMAPTTEALLDFVGRAIAGIPLLGPA